MTLRWPSSITRAASPDGSHIRATLCASVGVELEGLGFLCRRLNSANLDHRRDAAIGGRLLLGRILAAPPGMASPFQDIKPLPFARRVPDETRVRLVRSAGSTGLHQNSPGGLRNLLAP